MSSAKTATYADDTNTGHRWALVDWDGWKPTRDHMGTRSTWEAAQDVQELRSRGVTVTVRGRDCPGERELMIAAGGVK